MRRLSLVVTALAALAVGPGAAAASVVEERCVARRMARADAFIAGREGRVAYALVAHGLMWHRDGRDAFRTASLLKPLLLLAHLRRPEVARRALRPDERALLGPLIRRSDDDAANALVGSLGAARITRAARAAGQRDFRLVLPIWGLSQTSAIDQTRLMARLGRVTPARHRAYVRELLRTIVPSQRWGLGQAVPRGWTLRFKGGWGSGTGRVNSQAGWLERDGGVVVLAVMTEDDPSHVYGSATIEGVARRLLLPQPCAAGR